MSDAADGLNAALAEGAAVITANRRLARAVLDSYNLAQAANGSAAWETPDVLPWASWLQRGWETMAVGDGAQPLLLTAFQELSLWEQVVRDSVWGGALLQPAPAARAAREAWELAHAWCLDLAPLSAQRDVWGEDTRAFVDWAQSYTRRCAEHGWLDQARLADWVARRLHDGDADTRLLPSRLLLVGFDELTPQQTALVEVLREAGVAVEVGGNASPTQYVRAVALVDAEAEISAAARWARARLARSPQARIGVVVPDLTNTRARVERIFDDIMLPAAVLAETCTPEARWQARPFNISAGRPLSDYPLVHAAFATLELGGEPQPLERVGALLRSPFLGGAESEREARARFDARLRRRGETRIGVRGLLALLASEEETGASPAACSGLRSRLAAWEQLRQSLPARQAPGRWAEAIPRLLDALGWPGERSMDSIEYQTWQAFREQLGALAGLDVLEPRLTLAQALGALQRLCAAQLFQPEGGEAPVQILGTLEAAGLSFDYLWVMGLHDEAWPQAPRPNPLLPVRLQREAGIPHASPERELLFAARITERLCAAAPDVVLSWPQRDGDRDLRPSPLIAEHAASIEEPSTVLDALDDAQFPLYREALVGTAPIEALDDRRAPPVDAADVPGGTAIFKHQAACPFRAFAEHRLGAAPLEEAQLGLDARGRGIVLHTALERLWARLDSHAHLAALDADERAAEVHAAVEQAVDFMASRRPATFTPRFRELEVKRLVRLLDAWLDCELERAPFSVVYQEEEGRISLGGVTARLKIDRIDRLDDGGLAIIDYKSGRTDIRDWLGERPEEPQLPLYALSQDGREDVSAVLFAQLRPGELGFKGLTREDDQIPGALTLAASKQAADYADWHSLLAHWRETLVELGEAFRAGQAAVDPKQYPQTCRYCHLPSLCRVGEQHAFGPHETPIGEGDSDVDDAVQGDARYE